MSREPSTGWDPPLPTRRFTSPWSMPASLKWATAVSTAVSHSGTPFSDQALCTATRYRFGMPTMMVWPRLTTGLPTHSEAGKLPMLSSTVEELSAVQVPIGITLQTSLLNKFIFSFSLSF